MTIRHIWADRYPTRRTGRSEPAGKPDPSRIASITITTDSKPLLTCTNTTSCSATLQSKIINVGTHTIGATAINKNGLQGSISITIVDLK